MTGPSPTLAAVVSVAPGGARERNWALRIGATGTIIFVLSALAAPLLALHSPLTSDTSSTLLGFDPSHWLGTDEYGRDTLSRTLYASRVSLLVSLTAVSIGLCGGAIVGLVSGYHGGRLDGVLMRIMDLVFSFPAILLAIVVMAAMGTSVVNAMIAIGIIFIPGFARLARALTRSVTQEQFVAYARSTGVPLWRILLREVLPNIAPGLIVQSAVAMGTAITLEAALSFLGLGAQPPTPSWGNMINAGRGHMAESPLMVLVPAAAILFTVLSLNLLSQGLQGRLHERQHGPRG